MCVAQSIRAQDPEKERRSSPPEGGKPPEKGLFPAHIVRLVRYLCFQTCMSIRLRNPRFRMQPWPLAATRTPRAVARGNLCPIKNEPPSIVVLSSPPIFVSYCPAQLPLQRLPWNVRHLDQCMGREGGSAMFDCLLSLLVVLFAAIEGNTCLTPWVSAMIPWVSAPKLWSF